MNKKPLVVLPILVLLISCGSYNHDIDNSLYVEKSIKAFNYNNELKDYVECRFYNELPTIPYIDINSYYNLLLDKEIKITPIGDNVFKLESFCGEATIDVKRDIFKSDDYNEFINTTIYRDESVHNIYYDGAPYIKGGAHNPDKELPSPKTIDFSKYKIDFKYDDNKIWAPLITFSDMFKGVTMIQSFYNGENIFLYDSNNVADDTPIYIRSDYYNPIGDTFFKDNKRDPKVVELSYYEMCFNFDYYYGAPSLCPLGEMIDKYGFDYALENFSKNSKLVKDLLLSTEVVDYIAGMRYLSNLLNDGGHTVMDIGVANYLYSDAKGTDILQEEIDEVFNSSNYEFLPEPRTYDYNTYQAARKNMNANKSFTYNEDTFMYTFDSFDIDFEAWDKYYSNETSELPKDTIGLFYQGIETAKSMPNIKNFVLNIAINGGGFGDVVMYMIKAISNTSSMYYYDHIDERNITQEYLVDINLDGEFNELDNAPIADYNFGIVTSEISFSCGNLLPALAKGAGIPLLGEKTGGGACAVLDNCSMEGIFYRTSSFVHLTDKDYNSVDKGIEVDYNLVNVDSKKVVTNLFDINLISETMNNHYKK